MFWLGFLVGMMAGAFLGMTAMSLLVISRRAGSLPREEVYPRVSQFS
jgi:hypothetical protein